jgi:integrase
MRVKLTPGLVLKAALPEKGDRVIYWDTEKKGFGLMVTASGHRSFVYQYRTGGKSRRMHFKEGLTLDQARREVTIQQGKVAVGGDPLGDKRKADMTASNTLRAVCEEFLEREGGMRRDDKGQRVLDDRGRPIFKGGKLRSADQRAGILDRHVYPRLGSRQIDDIRRSDVVRLLDQVADTAGASMADHVLAVIRRVMTWHASRTDDYRSPIVRGMARTTVKEQARQRTLSDDELCSLWRTADELGTPFARMMQFILCTCVRRNEAARMNRSELAGSNWLIPGLRTKNKREFLIPMSATAVAVLATMPVIGSPDKGPIFTHDGKRALSGFGKAKAAFDKACGVTGYTIHDLRRTGRSIMSRAGVDPDHAERCLNHAMGGIRGTYDRHSFFNEKKAAFEALALQIDRILHPATNVVPFAAANEKRIPMTAG